MLNSIKSLAAISLFSIALGGGQCPGGGDTKPPPVPPVAGCVKDASKAGRKPGQQAWLDKNTARAVEVGAAIKPLLGDLKKAKVGEELKDSSDNVVGKVVTVGNLIVFTLSAYPDLLLKMAKGGNVDFVTTRLADSKDARDTVVANGLNCLIMPEDLEIKVDVKNAVYGQEYFPGVKSEIATLDQFETLYAQFPTNPKLEASFAEMFRQRVVLSCNGNDLDARYRSQLLSSTNDAMILIDISGKNDKLLSVPYLKAYKKTPATYASVENSFASTQFDNLLSNVTAIGLQFDPFRQRYHGVGLPPASMYQKVFDEFASCLPEKKSVALSDVNFISYDITDEGYFPVPSANFTVKMTQDRLDKLKTRRQAQSDVIQSHKKWLIENKIEPTHVPDLISLNDGTISKRIAAQIAASKDSTEPLWFLRTYNVHHLTFDYAKYCTSRKSKYDDLVTNKIIEGYICDGKNKYLEIRY